MCELDVVRRAMRAAYSDELVWRTHMLPPDDLPIDEFIDLMHILRERISQVARNVRISVEEEGLWIEGESIYD